MKDKEEKKKDKKKKKKSKAGRVILFLLLIILILLAILYFGDGFGFGIGGGTGSAAGDSVQAMATETGELAETTEPVEETGGPVVIEITESSVKLGNEEFADYAAFEEYFYQNKADGAEYILKDNQAIKSVYDNVKGLLDSFGCAYSEEIA